MMIIYQQEQNQTETKQVLKDNIKIPVTARQNPIPEPKENAIQMNLNLIYNIQIPRKQQILIQRLIYYVQVPKPFV